MPEIRRICPFLQPSVNVPVCVAECVLDTLCQFYCFLDVTCTDQVETLRPEIGLVDLLRAHPGLVSMICCAQYGASYLEAVLVRMVAQCQSDICLNLVDDSRRSSQSRFTLPILQSFLHQGFEPKESEELSEVLV